MASRLPLYFSLLFLFATAAIIVSSATPTATKERNEETVLMRGHFAEPRAEDDNTVHYRLLAGDEQMIGLQDYGDARANHRHDPHHPIAVKGNNKELDS